MKKQLAQLLVLTLIISSCQKEVSFDNAGGESKGSLLSIAGDCSPMTVNGSYAVGTALTASNTITVQLNVSRGGSYTVYTDTINGIYFRATGTFTTSGSNSVTLRGSGTPQALDTSDFIVRYDTSQCRVRVIVSAPAAGTLNCAAAVVNGTYAKNVALTSSNTVQIQVNVTTPGSYSVTTDTVRGIWFEASGNFATVGTVPLILNGHGTPDSAGTWTYRPRFGNSNCTFNVTVGSPGTGTLGGAPNACAPITVNGSYVQGTALSPTANTVQVQATIGIAGPVAITTDTVAGFYFNFSGNLGAGIQNITLAGNGTPNSTGTKTLTVKFGSSRCTFTVNVSAATNNDLFPLTLNSWWSYDDVDGIFVTGDSLTRKLIGTTTISGNIYSIIQNQDNTTPIDSSFFRKAGNDYLEFQWVDYYTAVFAFDAPQMGNILFLKEGLTLNQTWESAVFTGTIGGSPAWLKYTFQAIAINASASLNGNNFNNNVVKIAWRPKVSFDGTNYQDEYISLETWFVPGVGMIHLKVIDLSGQQGPYSINIQNWRVF